jgi:hypothetical protein
VCGTPTPEHVVLVPRRNRAISSYLGNIPGRNKFDPLRPSASRATPPRPSSRGTTQRVIRISRYAQSAGKKQRSAGQVKFVKREPFWRVSSRRERDAMIDAMCGTLVDIRRQSAPASNLSDFTRDAYLASSSAAAMVSTRWAWTARRSTPGGSVQIGSSASSARIRAAPASHGARKVKWLAGATT